jgi:hypothetical protein
LALADQPGNTELYDSMKVIDLIKTPPAVLSVNDNLHYILKKFDETVNGIFPCWKMEFTKDSFQSRVSFLNTAPKF